MGGNVLKNILFLLEGFNLKVLDGFILFGRRYCLSLQGILKMEGNMFLRNVDNSLYKFP